MRGITSMAGRVRFGVSIPTGREGLMVPTGFASKETIIDAARLAEESGYYSVWGNDHITTQNYRKSLVPKPGFYEPLISLAAVSSVTEKVKLGSGIFVLPWRTPSLVICAKQLATLDVLSGGRLILGIGTGAYREESDALLIRDRARRYEEGIRGLRELFENKISTFHGRYVKFRDVELYPKPIQKPLPLYLGHHVVNSSTLNSIARYAQGWIPGISQHKFKIGQERLEPVLKQYDRKLSDVELVREISVSLGKDHEDAVKKYQRTPAFDHYVSLTESWGRNPFGAEDVFGRSLIGNPDEVIDIIQSFVDVNVRHFMLNFAVMDAREFMKDIRSFANMIMPSF
jgi:alkanesulfonate monooxygenase SsuD/methylene tetrahydromethanopterin reductase-like flavin-dependent oxidoreductase (luciferase family)